MRPLFFDAPDDPEIWRAPVQWLLGDLLVAPVLEPGAVSWRTYLPSGRWVDAWTGDAVTGPDWVDADVADRCRLPVFVRATAWPRLRTVLRG